MIEKRLRMTLDLEVSYEAITDESLREHYCRSKNFEDIVEDAELWTNLSRQIRLQRVLLEDEEALRKYLTHVAVTEIDAHLDSDLAEVFGLNPERAEEEILGPVFERLEEDDARYFREVSEAGELFDNIEVLSRSFRVRWTGAVLEEIRCVSKGLFAEILVGIIFIWVITIIITFYHDTSA
jgi:hypothetical protein